MDEEAEQQELEQQRNDEIEERVAAVPAEHKNLYGDYERNDRNDKPEDVAPLLFVGNAEAGPDADEFQHAERVGAERDECERSVYVEQNRGVLKVGRL